MRVVHAFVVSVGALAVLAAPQLCGAQTRLTLDEAVDTALRTRPLLKAAAERVTAAQGELRQAGAWPNPQFEFTNENLRPGLSYGRNVDTLAIVTQPLDILGKRAGRVALAGEGVRGETEALSLARRDVAREVELAYWSARGAQERRDLLRASADNFEQIVTYHAAQFSVGTISEQDLLRIRLEREQIQIAADLAGIEATDTRAALLTTIGLAPDADVVLTEPLDAQPQLPVLAIDQAVAARADVRAARTALDEAQANARLQDLLARPDIAAIYGFKRTTLPDALDGVNTAVAGIRLTIPLFDRNQGNRQAAAADVRRQEQLLRETEAQARGDVERAAQAFRLRQAEVRDALAPLREHATSIATIAQAAYQQGGVELLRLLDAERARLDAERAWVDGMVAFQQSAVNFGFAQGAER